MEKNEKAGKRNFRVDRTTHNKAILILSIFGFMAAALVIALFRMQILAYEEYQGLVVRQMTTEIEVNPERGEIYDTNHSVLATNVTKYLSSGYNQRNGGAEGERRRGGF